MRRGAWLRVTLIAALVRLAFSCVAPDEFLCEESTAKLQECCPEFDAREITCERDYSCTFNRYGGRPTINERAASCVLDRSCADIRAAKICTSLPNHGSSATGNGRTMQEVVEEIACAP